MTGPAATVFEGEWSDERGNGSERPVEPRGVRRTQQQRDRTHGRTGRRRVPEAESEVLRGLRRRDRGDLRAASARRPRDPDRRAADRHAAREEPGARGQARASSSPTAPRTTRSARSCTARRSRCSPSPDLETTLAVLYHSLKEDFGVPQVAARLWGKVPEQSYLPELAATSSEIRAVRRPAGPAVLRARRRVRVARVVRGRRHPAVVRVPAAAHRAARSACSRSASPDPRALPPGHGHAVPDAPRRARERRDGAVPAAGVAGHDARRVRTAAASRRTPAPSAANAARARAFATHLATRPAHTREAYRARRRAARAARRRRAARRARRARSSRAISRPCTAADSRAAASRACCRRGARSTASCSSATARSPEDPCAGLKPPKSPRRLPSALSPDEAVQLVAIDADDPLSVRDRALLELAYSSGLRLSELAGLDVDRVDLAAARCA